MASASEPIIAAADRGGVVPLLRVELVRALGDPFVDAVSALGLVCQLADDGAVAHICLPTRPLPRALLEQAQLERVPVSLVALPLCEPFELERQADFAEPLFNAAQLARLVRSMLESSEAASPWLLVAQGDAAAVHWLHTPDMPLASFDRAVWSPARLWGPPLGHVRAYFGERVAFYFAFLESYTRALVWLALAGAPALVAQTFHGAADTAFVPFFAFAACLWVTLFAEVWKRRQVSLAAEWSVHGFEAHERLRPEFVGELTRGFQAGSVFVPAGSVSAGAGEAASVAPGLDRGLVSAAVVLHADLADVPGAPSRLAATPHFPHAERRRRMAASCAVVSVALAVVVIGMLALMVFRLVMMRTAFLGPTLGGIGGGVLNTLYIALTNHFYGKLAKRLTDWENHATQTAYDDAQVAKTFGFMFVNSYSSLFYLAFGKPFLSFGGLERGCPSSCFAELGIQLGSILITSIFLGNARELLLPYALAWFKRRARHEPAHGDAVGLLHTATGDEPVSQAAPRAPISDTDHIGEYAELVIQLGYVTLFAAAFPAAPLVVLANNLIEHRIDLFKLTRVCHRAPPAAAQDIGAWLHIIEFVGYAAVVSNLALLTVTSSALRMLVARGLGASASPAHVLAITVLAAVVGEHVLLGLKYGVAAWIADVPEAVANRLALEAHVIDLRRAHRRIRLGRAGAL